MRIEFDRDRLARFGLDVSTAAKVVQAKLLGDIPTQLSEGETRYDIRVRADRKYLRGLEDLWRLEIELGTGNFVPLASLADMRIVPGPSEIRRVGQRRVAVVSANLEGRDLGTVSREIQERLNTLPLPPGYSASLGGQNREMQTSFESLRFAMLLAVFLVYIVMASQFESLLHPFVILFSIPLGLIGVVYGLYLLEIPLSIVVFIGVIMLAGIMVNDAIVLVDYINVLRRRGVPRESGHCPGGSGAAPAHPDDDDDHRTRPDAHGLGVRRRCRDSGPHGRDRNRGAPLFHLPHSAGHPGGVCADGS